MKEFEQKNPRGVVGL